MEANIEDLNEGMEGWHEGMAWDGVPEGEYEACGKCYGDQDYKWNEDYPEWCQCTKEAEVKDMRFRIKGNVVSEMVKYSGMGGSKSNNGKYEEPMDMNVVNGTESRMDDCCMKFGQMMMNKSEPGVGGGDDDEMGGLVKGTESSMDRLSEDSEQQVMNDKEPTVRGGMESTNRDLMKCCEGLSEMRLIKGTVSGANDSCKWTELRGMNDKESTDGDVMECCDGMRDMSLVKGTESRVVNSNGGTGRSPQMEKWRNAAMV